MNINLEDDEKDDDYYWERAFHEAGHLWAARQLGLPIKEASIWTGQVVRPPMRADQAPEYTLAGVLAQALRRELLDASEEDLLRPLHACDVDLQIVWEAADDIAGGGYYCCRGSDPEAVPVLAAPLSRIEPVVNRLLNDWYGIDWLTLLLFENKRVAPLQIRRCLASS